MLPILPPRLLTLRKTGQKTIIEGMRLMEVTQAGDQQWALLLAVLNRQVMPQC